MKGKNHVKLLPFSMLTFYMNRSSFMLFFSCVSLTVHLCMPAFFSCLVVFVSPKATQIFPLFYRCIANWLSPFLSPFLFVFVYLFILLLFFNLQCVPYNRIRGFRRLHFDPGHTGTNTTPPGIKCLCTPGSQIFRPQCGCELVILGHSSGKLSPRCLAGDGGRGQSWVSSSRQLSQAVCSPGNRQESFLSRNLFVWLLGPGTCGMWGFASLICLVTVL